MSDETTAKKARAKQTGVQLEADIIKKIDAQLGRLPGLDARKRIVQYVARMVVEQEEKAAYATAVVPLSMATHNAPRPSNFQAEDLFG